MYNLCIFITNYVYYNFLKLQILIHYRKDKTYYLKVLAIAKLFL